ncbi:MAG: biopolymer transporter ExbD [Gemmataceae bacterium]|nr:biopolymer transporter ExbD [Gemmataceae bacterium]
MAEKKSKTIDVWIVESNTVYKEVPFTVVADWTQQGRLLEDDNVRQSGTEKWHRLGKVPAFAAYLPRVDPMRAEDQAEALEPVEVDFAWHRRPADEDDDVDMIPLIDISLVLLIFFMMTSTVVIASSNILVPDTEHGTMLSAPGVFWIGIDKGKDDPVYSIGEGDKAAAAEDSKLDEKGVLQRLDARLKDLQEPVEVRVTAHRDLPFDVVKRMTVALAPYQQKRKISFVRAEVSEKQP